MTQEYKEIPGYEGFVVNQVGKVKRLSKTITDSIGRTSNYPERAIKSSVNKKGYERVELCTGNGIKKPFTVHRLVILAFKGVPPHGFDQINHIDGNKLNNYVSNLEWSNNSHNIKHAWKTGLFKPKLPKSIDSPHAVLLLHKEYGVFSTILDASRESGINRIKLANMVRNVIPNQSKYILA